jgi:hypothetical protein
MVIKKVLEIYGDLQIRRMWVGKTPVSQNVSKILDLITFGGWSRAQKMYYDQMFHLYMVAELFNGVYIRFEKNQSLSATVINLRDAINDQVLYLPIDVYPNYSQLTTLNKMFQAALAKHGAHRIFDYDGVTNNCQRFILDLLMSSDIIQPTQTFEAVRDEDIVGGYVATTYSGTIISQEKKTYFQIRSDEIYQFIAQNAASIFNQFPSLLGDIARFATTQAARLDYILYGSGL